MPVREQASQFEVLRALDRVTINNTTPVDGDIIDTARRPAGLGFFIRANSLTTGDFTVIVQEGDQADMSDAATVQDEAIVGQVGTRVISAAITGGTWEKMAVVATKRYARINVTGASTPNASLEAIAVYGPDVVPEK